MTGRFPLGASTLGAPGVPLETVAGWLSAGGATWVELRAAEGEPVHLGLCSDECDQARAILERANVQPLALASYVRVASVADDESLIADLVAHVELAARLGCRFVRVFPGAAHTSVSFAEAPALDRPTSVVDGWAARRLAHADERARALGVRIVLETHDSHPRGADVARLLGVLDQVAPGHTCGAIWDVLHPWRVGERPENTWNHLARHVLDGRGYVQVKDVGSRTDLTPVLLGQGVLPLGEVAAVLTTDYRGPLSLEWEKAWYPDIPPLDRALSAARAQIASW